LADRQDAAVKARKDLQALRRLAGVTRSRHNGSWQEMDAQMRARYGL
jgi:hypothetical protein